MAALRTLRLKASDNVIIAIDEIPAGATPEGGEAARQRIPKGHKMATAVIGSGEPVLGQIIGFASRPIAAGDWVHDHNCTVKDFARDPRIGEDARREAIVPTASQPTFQGFLRANGNVGTRNIWRSLPR